MKTQSFAATQMGKQASQNRDAFLEDPELGLFIVCDGLRRHDAAGEVALKAAQIVQSLLYVHRPVLQKFKDNPSYFNQARATYAIETAVQAANGAIFDAGQQDPDQAGMATAIAVLLVADHNAIYTRVGDTGIFYIHQGKIESLNKDHRSGTKPGSEDPSEPVPTPGEVEEVQGLGVQPTILLKAIPLEINPGDRFVLCTDGLVEYIPDTAEIVKICGALPSADIPKGLVAAAAGRNAHDNATALYVLVESENPAKDVEDDKKSQMLRRLPLFQHLSSLEVFRVLEFMTVRDFKPGEKVVTEREVSDELYISFSGQFKVVKNGKILAELDKGSFFGEMGMINKLPRSADVIAKVNSRILVMRRADFKRLISYEPHLAVKLLWSLSAVLNERLRNTSEDLTMLMQMADEADDFFDDEDDDSPKKIAD